MSGGQAVEEGIEGRADVPHLRQATPTAVQGAGVALQKWVSLHVLGAH